MPEWNTVGFWGSISDAKNRGVGSPGRSGQWGKAWWQALEEVPSLGVLRRKREGSRIIFFYYVFLLALSKKKKISDGVRQVGEQLWAPEGLTEDPVSVLTAHTVAYNHPFQLQAIQYPEFCGHQESTWYLHIQVGKTLIHIKSNWTNQWGQKHS